MADYIVGSILLIALFFALRHIYGNLVAGQSDCCLGSGCNGCSGKGCEGCHPRQ